MKTALLLFICMFTSLCSLCAQPFQLRGVVVAEQDDKPLTGASVFINNASKGAITDGDGKFSLADIRYNTFELVVSYVGYETIVVNISPENIG
ncbi:MAG TPA: carboxypeptidase-like regulatory domain-containing protein, partial [Segetibacter sp.]